MIKFTLTWGIKIKQQQILKKSTLSKELLKLENLGKPTPRDLEKISITTVQQ
jgi:hypothetical protein